MRWRNQTIHLVALMPEGAGDALSAGLRQQHDARERRSHEIAARMEKLGLSDAMQRAREQATLSGSGDRPLSRPDFARAGGDLGLPMIFRMPSSVTWAPARRATSRHTGPRWKRRWNGYVLMAMSR